MSRLINDIALANFCSSSVLPIALAAWASCLRSSSSRRITRIIEPSNTSVIFETSKKEAPFAHAYATGTNPMLKLSTYLCTRFCVRMGFTAIHPSQLTLFRRLPFYIRCTLCKGDALCLAWLESRFQLLQVALVGCQFVHQKRKHFQEHSIPPGQDR